MAMEFMCPVCSSTMTAESDEDMVREAQAHMQQVHNQTISREEAMRMFSSTS